MTMSEREQPNQDSNPPLVVDMPDGPKLIVGKIESDTVIEVATWRGVGRPDSRTNRLMLGVTREDENREAIAIETPQVPRAIENNKVSTSAPQSGERVSTGINYAFVMGKNNSDTMSVAARGEEIEKESNSWLKQLSGIAVSLFLIAGLLGFAGGPLGLRITNPTSGAQSSLGDAASALFVVQKDTDPEVGNRVVFQESISAPEKSIGVVAAKSELWTLISSDGLLKQVRNSNIEGNIVAALPFLGKVISLF